MNWTCEGGLGSLDPLLGSLDPLLGTLDALLGTLDAPLGTLDAPLGSLDAPLGSLDAPLGTLDAPLGSLDAPLGSLDPLLGSLDAPLGSLDAPLGSLDPLLGTLDPLLGTLDPLLGTLDPLLGSLDPLPCILVMDSLKRSLHERVFKLLREYLESEWEVRRGSSRDFGADEMQSSHCKVPLQDNSSDCGLYLLHYVESFLKDPVVHFDLPLHLERWFPRQQVRRKRDEIRDLVLNLYRKQQLDRKR
ncbi:Sentrin-specific protease 7 [Takifugu flavidus]|uniref:Sentrin-specific protease 7 n=1 Tax=Takifugu flavidus TaxID=433684 RepID=A0A5C6PNR4_9TELE|nr:Sentrin-specific protease 7 [Takifugu flavidus]